MRRERLPAMVAAMCLAMVACRLAAEEDSLPALSTIATVRSLPRDEIAQTPRVRIRGVVTHVRRAGTAMFVQDDTAGAYVNIAQAMSRDLWRDDGMPFDAQVGTEVEIEGVIDPGGFSPQILPTSFRVLGEKPRPAARPIISRRFFAGADDSAVVEVVGVVQDVVGLSSGWRLTMQTDGNPFLAEVPLDVMPQAPEKLIDARVRVAGPAGSAFNTRGEFLMPRVYVGSREDFAIIAPRLHEPFESPYRPIGALAGFRLEAPGDHMVQTDGIVVHAEPGRSIHVQSGAGGVLVQTRATLPLAPGDRVEVAGFLERHGAVTGLAHALVRRLRGGSPPQPIRIRPDEIMTVNRRAATSSLMAEPGDYQGCLVQFPGRFVEARPTVSGGGLVLSAEGMNLFASASSEVFGNLKSLQPGSDLLVTGIAHIEWEFDSSAWPPRLPKQFQLLLRSPADVAVIRAPSWWTPRRLAALAATIGAVLTATLAWAWLLRHELAMHKTLLANEMRTRRDAVLEFEATLKERNRLAANLHDTLLQTLGGIGYQLDACEGSRIQDEADARMHFDVARRMVSHATNELHQSVWAMRTLPLGQESFPDAMRALAYRLGEGHAATIGVHTSGAFTAVSDFVAGNLLLIMQEAVTNALRHGQPSVIEIAADEHCEEDTITLRVSDDGVGFEPVAAAGLSQGHFGVYGMRERAQRLGGSLTIESKPGRGTAVIAVVSMKDYDRDIAEPAW